MKSARFILISLIGVLLIGTAGYYGFSSTGEQPSTPEAPQTIAVNTCDVQQTVTAPGELHNTSETQVLMPVDGKLSEVLVQAGDPVSAGQVLARLDDTSRAQAQIDLKDAKEAYEKAYNYRKSLDGKTWLQRITWKQVGAQSIPVPHWYRGYAAAETIADADNDLALREAQLEDAQAVLDHMELTSPFDGFVIEMEAVAGQPLLADATLFKLIDPKALEVKANVTQEDYPLLEPGQNAQVYFDARPDVIAEGKVDRIVPKLVSGDSPTYDIYISLDEVPDGLVDGMTADANVTIENHAGVLCLPRSIVHASGGDTAVLQVWTGTSTEERKVMTGLRGDANVEIVSGLQEGELVVVK